MKLSFILGKTPLLSLAELTSVLESDEIISWRRQSLIVDKDASQEELKRLQDQIGGTIKICEVMTEIETNSLENRLLQQTLEEILITELEKQAGKRRFGLSIYPVSGKDKKILKYLLIFLKKKLKKTGNCRFVNKNFENVSSIQVETEHLLDPEKGVELVMIFAENSILMGKTITIQNSRAYAKRDYEKPCRDAHAGMLPPKLAQMMLNFAYPWLKEKSEARSHLQTTHHTIYDPFCGTGTILGEALLQGHNVIGSDNQEKALNQSKTNVTWLKKQFDIPENLETHFFQHSVEQPFSHNQLRKHPDAVVTESSLGPALSHYPSQKELTNISHKLLKLHIAFFNNIKKILKPNTPIVICFPVFGTVRYFEKVNLKDKLTELGFKTYCPLPRTYSKLPLIYKRPDQIVGREIQVWLR